MLKNYIKVAWRNLAKRKFYTAIMVLGLAVGLSFSLIVGSFVYAEYQVNKGLKNVENQYLITSSWAKPNMGVELTTMAPLANTLKEKYPDLIQNSYSIDAIGVIVKKGEEVHSESVQLGDSEVLKMYGFPLIHGDPETALIAPDEMVISEKVALKYFGKSNVLNETLEVESFSGKRRDFVIKGVLGNIPFNSVTHLVYEDVPILMSKESLRFFNRYASYNSWTNPYVASFLELKEGIKPEALQVPIHQILKENATEEVAKNLTAQLQPLSTFYLTANNGLVQNTLNTLMLIGLFILFMAVVNFINITIGNSSERLKEMGVRKTMGGMRKNIVFQFLIESMMLTIVSMSMALLIYENTKEYFGDILGKPLVPFYDLTPSFLIYATLFSLFIGLLSGLYPAMSISALPTVTSLKGKMNNVKENVRFRMGLLTLQFAISLFVLAATYIVSQQIDYLFSKDLGFNKEHIVHVKTPRDWSVEGVRKMITIRNEFGNIPSISSASLAYEIPDGNAGFNTRIQKEGENQNTAIYAPMMQVDEKYLDIYSIELKHGRYFDGSHSERTEENQEPQIIINETAAKSLGFENTKDAVNETIQVDVLDGSARILGVVSDFHFGSMHDKIKPIIMANVHNTSNYRFLTFKIFTENVSKTLGAIESKWKDLLPNSPFDYNFLDRTLQNMYQSEARLKKATQVASFLSFVIVILGVLGLVSISVTRRTKEVGIRKVLGASLREINWIFLKEFIVIGIIAMLFSFPVLYHFSGQWLDNYAYRIDIDYKIFLIIALMFCMIISAMIYAQIYSRVKVNPADSLRTE